MEKNDINKNLEEAKEFQEQYEKKEEKDYRRRIFLFVFFITLVFASTFGITYSVYKGDSGENSEIITDKIIFNYSDVDKVGSGINMTDTYPITDTTGKNLMGSKQYFDFSIMATSKNTNIRYKLLARKGESTLSNNDVRIYLTRLNGNREEQLLLDTFSNLKVENINNQDYYVLYVQDLEKGIDNYADLYRLRMWIKEDATDYQDKTFQLKVDVYAVQVGD